MDSQKDFRVRLDVSYDGSLFLGWQKQKEDDFTAQGVLESKLSQLFNEKISVMGSGRTDRGVHAVQQVVHFDCSKDPRKMNLIRALQSLCPDFLVIKKAYLVGKDFHSLRSAESKTYKYLICNSKTPSALKWNKCLWINKPLNIEYLNEISKFLIGTHDFKSFQNSGTEVKTTVRTIYEAAWKKKGAWVIFTITGNGFLKQMVRNIVGAMLYYESKNEDVSSIKKLLLAQDRKMAPKTAKAHALYLYKVNYPKDIDSSRLKI